MSMSKACGFIDNFTSAHESRLGLTAEKKLDYPLNHIECDNRLSWLLGPLYKKYGDSAVYVFLKRDIRKVALSYNRRWHIKHGIVKSYADGILMCSNKDHNLSLAEDYVQTVNDNVELFLSNVKNKVIIDIECPDKGFEELWGVINASGDYKKALDALKKTENKTNKKINKYRIGKYKIESSLDRFEDFFRRGKN